MKRVNILKSRYDIDKDIKRKIEYGLSQSAETMLSGIYNLSNVVKTEFTTEDGEIIESYVYVTDEGLIRSRSESLKNSADTAFDFMEDGEESSVQVKLVKRKAKNSGREYYAFIIV